MLCCGGVDLFVVIEIGFWMNVFCVSYFTFLCVVLIFCDVFEFIALADFRFGGVCCLSILC